MVCPTKDGITHINIYSQGKTWLGKNLSNFAYFPIETEDGKFNSIEGYWYWLSCKDDRLRTLSGYNAKKLGRELGGKDWLDDDEFKRKITDAISRKIMSNQRLHDELKKSTLPLLHYYVFGGAVVEPNDGRWVIEHIENIRQALQNRENLQ